MFLPGFFTVVVMDPLELVATVVVFVVPVTALTSTVLTLASASRVVVTVPRGVPLASLVVSTVETPSAATTLVATLPSVPLTEDVTEPSGAGGGATSVDKTPVGLTD